MQDNKNSGGFSERRSEQRHPAEVYHSVQMTVPGLPNLYMFKIWNISSKGMCVLVKHDSAILKHLKVGDELKMTYFTQGPAATAETLETRIEHITQNQTGRFAGHYLVGLSII